MSRGVFDIVANLDGIESLATENELQRLDECVSELFASEKPEAGVAALLRIFERFPNQDGFGIFWSIVHGLESLPGYELPLVESVRRQPSLFGLLMINRLLNAGTTTIEDHNLLSILENIAANNAQPEEIRREAQDFVEFQKRNR